jgi:bifunctional non-homologous end joining protein LigD
VDQHRLANNVPIGHAACPGRTIEHVIRKLAMAKDDKLQHYRAKRDFSITSEPEGREVPQGQALSFVIQKHAARRLHYDFRLELDGTLKSWAVPKGPSLDPADKRMAVHVEDHPLAYGGFEGVIPAGQYGAGTVIVWDRGEWLPHGDPVKGYRDGKLKFELRGHKLQGSWTLVRMRGRGQERQEPWLLIKERDEAARPAADYDVVEALPDSVLKRGSQAAPARGRKPRTVPLPLTQAPQLATLVDSVPDQGDWVYEIKFDGYRLLARIDEGAVRLFTRNGHDWTSRLKGLAKELGRLKLTSGWLDGEIVVIGANGGTDFQALQNAFDESRPEVIQYFLFDLLHADGEDLRELPLQQRRERLRALIEQSGTADEHPHVRYSEDFEVAPSHLLHTACAMRMEGVIGKRRDAPYRSGRSDAWIKLKCTQRQEFVIGGYTDPKGARQGLGALLLGVHDEHGQLHYAGNVGTGFDAQTLQDLQARLQALSTDKPAFAALPRDVKGHWVKPSLVAEVSFAEWTQEGRLRQAVFHGLRTDKPPRSITREKALAPPKVEAPTRRAKHSAAKPGTARGRADQVIEGVRITHADRVIDPSTGVTKGELADYHARAARRMLPHLAGRPVSLVRAPEGIQGELFFQKHADRMSIPGIERLEPTLDPGHAPLLAVPTRQALVGAAQMNVIELHTWNATKDHIEQPDRMTFDLDPGEGVAWVQVQEAAELVRAMLEELSLRSFLKTSGGKGLHVVVPFKPSLGWDEVKGLSKALVEHLAMTLPDRFVSKSGPRNRVGKIFVDYLRNGRGATTASAWTVRARPGMGVSVPVDWSELKQLTSGAHWTIRTVDARLQEADPWAGYRRVRQTLAAAIKAMS